MIRTTGKVMRMAEKSGCFISSRNTGTHSAKAPRTVGSSFILPMRLSRKLASTRISPTRANSEGWMEK